MGSWILHGDVGRYWTSVVWSHRNDGVRVVATAQSVQWNGRNLLSDQKIALYDAAIQGGHPTFILTEQDNMKVIYLPDDEQTDFASFKEVAAGLGGMGEAASFLGLKYIFGKYGHQCYGMQGAAGQSKRTCIPWRPFEKTEGNFIP